MIVMASANVVCLKKKKNCKKKKIIVVITDIRCHGYEQRKKKNEHAAGHESG